MVKMLMFDLKKSEREFLREFDTSDFDITYFDESLTKDTKLTVKECDETAILSVFLTSKITKEVLDKFKNLRLITTRSVCYHHIDINECRRRNIGVINVGDYGRSSVSQYVIGLIFALTRNIFTASEDIKKSNFDYEKYESQDIDKLSIGVIGTGSIGSAVCELAYKLGMKVNANDIIMNKDIKEFTEYMSLNDLLRKSDIVTLHIPYVKEFKYMISDKEFALMKDGSYIINVSNSALINPFALYRAINKKKIKGAGLDVIIDQQDSMFYENLEHSKIDELERIIIRDKLIHQENVIITPRIAYDTKESSEKIIRSNFNDIKDFYIGRKTNRVV